MDNNDNLKKYIENEYFEGNKLTTVNKSKRTCLS